jgi:predicted membrane-bound spermidine synthase
MRDPARALAVTLLSAGTLAFEILLVRMFAIEQFYHFAYMAIGVAMLGFGASGTYVTLWGRRPAPARERRFVASAALTPLLLLAAPLIADLLSFDITQLAIDPGQWLRLGILYAVLALPFAMGALAVLLAITLDASRPGRLYGASFAGSGLGAFAAIGALWVVDPVRAIAIPALLAGAGALAASVSAGASRRWHATAGIGVVLAAAGVAVPPWTLDVTPYKGLPQVEAYPGAKRVAEATTPVGWVVAVQADAFRHAPGLSLAYRGAFPPQAGLFVDGELAGALTRWDSANAQLLDWLPAAIPYALGRRERVLVIGAGGGIDVHTALRHDATRVTAIELNPDLVRFQQRAPSPPGWDAGTKVRWVTGDARSHVAATRETFDLIAIGAGGGMGPATAGLHSLNEDYLHTVDAYATYLRHLRPGGVLAVTRWLTVPPRASVRVVLTAAQALERVAPGSAGRGLLVVRSWGTATTVVKPDGFSPDEIDSLEAWLVTRRFDVDWRLDLDGPPTPRFNRVGDVALYRAAAAAVAGDSAAAAFLDDYPFVVAPVSDARPYPHHYLDLGAVRRLLAAGGGGWLPFAEWGYLAVVATVLQSIALAGLLTVVPAAVRTRAVWQPGLGPLLLYFTAIGFAFLAAEIAAIQQLGLLLGHPVYAVSVVLAVMLACSGAGSMWSDRVGAERGATVAAIISALLVACALLLLDIAHLVQPARFPVRALVAVGILGPIAFLMGGPFPLGLRTLASDDPTRVAWAWAMNGFASVVAAPLAALIALEAGTRWLFAAAAAGYAGAALLHYRRVDPERRHGIRPATHGCR